MNHFALPFKSVALALLFSLILGPIGLLYSSVTGGVILILLAVYALRTKLFALMLLIWLASCVVGVVTTNRFNQNLLRTGTSK